MQHLCEGGMQACAFQRSGASKESTSFSVDVLAVVPKELKYLMIDQNFSELSACLTVPADVMLKGFKAYRFTSLFQNQAGKRRLAISYSTPTKRQRGAVSSELS
eukprot:4975846-Amphidinium_carterae.1